MDGRPIREYPLDTLRANIGFVPQETFLFSERFGRISPSAFLMRVRIRSCALPKQPISAKNLKSSRVGFETLVGERGLTLSGGQKQRSALARAILRDPSILILDDSLASVDTYTEERILEELRQIIAGANDHSHIAPHLDRAERGSDRSACPGAHRRVGNTRRVAGAKRPLCEFIPEANYSKKSWRSRTKPSNWRIDSAFPI